MIYTKVQDLIKDLEKKIKSLDKAFSIAVITTHAEQVNRIFERGEGASGRKIGTYNSTKALYVNPKPKPPADPPPRRITLRGKPTGKRKLGKTTFKNGKPHKTGYFKSYKDFRAQQGREANFVNLRLVGLLQSDFANSLRRSGNSYFAEIKNPANVKKYQGAVKKYGQIVWKLSGRERALFFKTFNFEKQRLGL